MQYKLEDEDTLMASNYVSRWLRAMQCDARLTFADRGFAGALAIFATHETGRDCYPSNLRLSLMGDVTERSITRYRNKLVATGWIAIVRDGRGREATEVELTFPDPICYDLSLLTRKLDDETRQDCQVKPDTGVRFQNANLTDLSVQTRQDCQVKPDTGVTPPTHGPTQEPTQRERAVAQSQHVAHEQAREADALPSPSEQIGQGQQASVVTAEIVSTVRAEVTPPVEVVTAEIVEIPRKVEAPPVTGQALMGEGHVGAGDTPDAEVYIAAVVGAIKASSSMHVRPGAWALAQLVDKARTMGWAVDALVADVQTNIADYARRGLSWRLDWLLRDMGTRAAAKPAPKPMDHNGYSADDPRRAVWYAIHLERDGKHERAKQVLAYAYKLAERKGITLDEQEVRDAAAR